MLTNPLETPTLDGDAGGPDVQGGSVVASDLYLHGLSLRSGSPAMIGDSPTAANFHLVDMTRSTLLPTCMVMTAAEINMTLYAGSLYSCARVCFAPLQMSMYWVSGGSG